MRIKLQFQTNTFPNTDFGLGVNMDIEINSCNNVDQGKIQIFENKLNIKYAINGIGKTTISKAICCSVNDRLNRTNKLSDLTPFKLLGNDEIKPSVDGTDDINSIMVFDEEFIDKFTYKPDELLEGSFDVCIRGEDY